MEPNDNEIEQQYQQLHLSSSYHHHHHHPATDSTAATYPDDGSPVVYPHSVPSSAVTAPLEPVKRKRGRPRKYGTPEQAMAARRMASPSISSSNRGRRKRAASAEPSSFSGSSRKSQLASLGNTGQGFTPHIINVAAGEDVNQKIMLFLQQSRHELCVLSASGVISNASLSQPATSGGNITYAGQFDILSLSGSFVRTEHGERTGGLSICLCSTDGQIIGGGVGGPLKAAGLVQVIVGTFQIASGGSGRFHSPVGIISPLGVGGFQSGTESSGRNPARGNEQHHRNMGGGLSMNQPSQGLDITSSRHSERNVVPDVRSSAGYDLTGRTRYQFLEDRDCK